MPVDHVREAFETRARQVYESVVDHISAAEQASRRMGRLLHEGGDDERLASEFETLERIYREAVASVSQLETEILESGVAFLFHGLAHPSINLLHALAGFIGGVAATIQGWAKPKLAKDEGLFPRLGEAAQRLNEYVMNTMHSEGFEVRPAAE